MKNLFNSKRLVGLLVTGLLLVGLTLSAQNTRRGEGGESHGEGNGMGANQFSVEHIEEMVENMTDELSLTEDQAAKITKIFKAHFADVKALQEEKTGDRDTKRSQMDNLRKGFEKKVNSLLTPEQQELFKEMNRNKKPAGKGQMGGRSKN